MKVCNVCNTEFLEKNSTHYYCSAKCRRSDWRKNNRERYLKTTKEYNKKYQLRIRKKRGKIIKECEFCGNNFEPLPQHPYQKYCGYMCRNKMFKKLNPEKVKQYKKKDKEKNREHYLKKDMDRHDKIMFGGNREKALERDNHKCCTCNKDSGLVVHHKDFTGQSDNANNELENLITLCRSCHIKIHKY